MTSGRLVVDWKCRQSKKIGRIKIYCLLLQICKKIVYEIIGEGSQISTNQKRESTVSWLLIGRNLRPFPDNFVLYRSDKNILFVAGNL